MRKIILRINRVVDYINAALFVVITIGVLTAVFGRYMFRYPLPAAMELAYFAMLWCAFIKTGQALYEDRHIGMALVKKRFTGVPNAIIGMVINAVVLVPCMYLGFYAGKMAWEAWAFGWKTSGGLPVPKWALYGIMALGAYYLIFIAVYKIWSCASMLRGDNHGG
ncbi:MAG: TRAP transporter small permease [Proteobacteria bacterium]|nr:TRAP transporter small permease [Pseudomonadota bacterium]MBU4574914.1 TRAP transporter small permease [Pseudomonadota bacterium]MBU4597104.1 TRAP transporter small permease [Pseudomonadota bacterium]MBV1715346.1 TRAP transporter small permease [Desulfarculus sp.]